VAAGAGALTVAEAGSGAGSMQQAGRESGLGASGARPLLGAQQSCSAATAGAAGAMATAGAASHVRPARPVSTQCCDPATNASNVASRVARIQPETGAPNR
jgi:hypothetical protein